ncbi:anaphase-promoting complex subunit 2-like [Xenia sp. Carnegie-2017]|uniref:anaphase-promoting complex subunit 2-like n=1 Tax=Xenia sp. Carnegie-2017 TaxID=2897299 RepID=UPI001F049D7E|nr:anaphase-promoting complex subunit 2-like [Xenia sp. Carnegie-2017]
MGNFTYFINITRRIFWVSSMATLKGLSIGDLWKKLTSFLDPFSQGKKIEIKEALRLLYEACGQSAVLEEFLLDELKKWFLEQFESRLRENISKKFWMLFKDGANVENILSSVKHLHQMIEDFHGSIMKFNELTKQRKIMKCIDMKSIHAITRVTIFSHPPEHFKSGVEDLYARAFKAFEVIVDRDVDAVDDEIKETNEDCNEFLERFSSWNAMLYSLGVLKHVCCDSFVLVIHTKVKAKVEELCKGEFDLTFLPSLMKWLNDVVLNWMKRILPSKGFLSDDLDVSIVESWRPRLEYFVYKTYAELRIEELFGVIVDYPDSLKALEDLKKCLEKTDLRQHLIKSLRLSFETRLLHPGAETTDILTQYVSAIRALRVLDSTGVILESVCEPVKAYLRTREDTVRCIVSNLTDENSSELSEELLHGDTKTIEDVYPLDSDTEDDDEEWMPDPIDADPTKPSRSRKSSDIISMLVNIYGSRDLFVSEYRTLLADRILSSFNYDVPKELHYLELLKLRFGESHLHYCEVMLKDVADSRRINANIHSKMKMSDKNLDIEIHGMIVSSVFWPSFRKEKLELPPQIKSAMDMYTEQFKSLKGSRTLEWKAHLGSVDLELEFEDRTLSFNVSPSRAAVIMYFQEKSRWHLDELSSTMRMPVTVLRRCLGYWLSQNVLKQDTEDVYVVQEKRKDKQDVHDVVYMGDGESAMATSRDRREGELQIFWSYIVGMLTNLDSLPLDRIHSMLRMFAVNGPTQCNLDDLKRFLERKVREGELQYASGKYRLPKAGR